MMGSTFPDEPIALLSWSPSGDLLACGSSHSGQITIWARACACQIRDLSWQWQDVERQQNAKLWRMDKSTIHLLWAPSGSALLTTSANASFRYQRCHVHIASLL